jgi:ABC-2 type transport system permease protein
MADANTPRPAGTIYDLGYQHYAGERRGRGYAFRTLFGHSFLTAFGIGRGAKARQLPSLVTILTVMPAMIMVGIGSATNRPEIINYSQHLGMAAFFIALFVAGQAAEVIVGDKETGTLALYYSRSLHTSDYAIAKLLALAAAITALTFGPQFMMFVGKVLLSETPWPAFKGEYIKLLPMAGGTMLVSFYMAAVGLALASLAAKRANGSALVIAFFIVLPSLQTLVFQILRGSENQRFTVLINPFLLMTGFGNWLYDVEAKRGMVRSADLPETYYLWVILGTCAVAIAGLLFRYRKAEV